jgi:hypothetical protein
MQHISPPVWVADLFSLFEMAKKKRLAQKLRPKARNLVAVVLLHHKKNVARLADFSRELARDMTLNRKADPLGCGLAFRINALSDQSV